MRIVRLSACAFLLAAGLIALAPVVSFAQFTGVLGSPAGGTEINQNGPMGALGPPIPEPPGAGPTPAPLLPGDSQAATPPATGQADPTTGSMFQTGVGSDRTIIHVYRQTNGGSLGQSRGTREDQTIRPDQLSSDQISAISGILGVNMSSGEGNVDVTATDSQLEQVQAILAPYPGYQMNGNRKKITQDQPAQGYPKPNEQNIYDFQGPLPTVRTFCRYLVTLGVVVATIWMAMAAMSVVMGDSYGGARVIGVGVGLMFLLGSYTIWKVVQMNTFKANSNSYQNQSRPTTASVSPAYLTAPNLPVVPQGTTTGPSRAGIPLVPYGDATHQ